MTALSENVPADVPGISVPAGPRAGVTVQQAAGDRPARVPAPSGGRGKRPRLVHVDAMRPVKQFGVVSTHSLQAFGAAASLWYGGTLMVTHVTRYAFMFISAAMLVYAYPALNRSRLKVFWRRRLLAVAVPYVTWTVIYFLLEVAQSGGAGGVAGSLEHLGYLLATGYDQLYYLVLLIEFYLVYPLLLWVIRRTARHHWALLAAVLGIQVALSALVHWGHVPGWMNNRDATRELWNYLLYVFAGGVMAWHYHEAHAWLCRHWRAILAGTAAAWLAAEAWYLLSAARVPFFAAADPQGPASPIQPAEIPLFLGLIAIIYLFGVWLGGRRRPRLVRAFARSGADYSYGIYLSQVLLLTALTTAGWRNLDHRLPWPAVTVAGILIVFSASWALTALLARLPGARGTAGIPRRSWRLRRDTGPVSPAGPAPRGTAGLPVPAPRRIP